MAGRWPARRNPVLNLFAVGCCCCCCPGYLWWLHTVRTFTVTTGYTGRCCSVTLPVGLPAGRYFDSHRLHGFAVTFSWLRHTCRLQLRWLFYAPVWLHTTRCITHFVQPVPQPRSRPYFPTGRYGCSTFGSRLWLIYHTYVALWTFYSRFVTFPTVAGWVTGVTGYGFPGSRGWLLFTLPVYRTLLFAPLLPRYVDCSSHAEMTPIPVEPGDWLRCVGYDYAPFSVAPTPRYVDSRSGCSPFNITFDLRLICVGTDSGLPGYPLFPLPGYPVD